MKGDLSASIARRRGFFRLEGQYCSVQWSLGIEEQKLEGRRR